MLKSSDVTSNRMDSLLSVQSSGTTANGSSSKCQRSTTSRFVLVDRELIRNDINVDHHHTLLSDALTLLYKALDLETPQTKMTEKSTNKGYVSNATL